MKKYSVIVIVFFLMLNTAWAELRNGYEKDIRDVREKLKNYTDLMNTNTELSFLDKRSMKTSIKRLIALQSYYELTEELLKQFKLISPDLYDRIDSIKDAKGRPTNIFVKFIPRDEALVMAGGITLMSRSDEDTDACFSEYGKHSVSIKIWIFDRALFALAHEFGHVNYQVPNLETYAGYYKRVYQPYFTDSKHLGHSGNDRSGRSASTFENKFKKDHRYYLRFRNDDTPFESPMSLIGELKKKASNVRY